MVFKVLPTHIDAEFHGESISDGFRAIRARKVGQKLKKPKKVAKLDSQVTPLSRTTPHRTVGGAHIAGFCCRNGGETTSMRTLSLWLDTLTDTRNRISITIPFQGKIWMKNINFSWRKLIFKIWNRFFEIFFQKSRRFRAWRTQCQRDPHCKRPFGEGLREISRLQRVARAKVGVKLLRLG